MVVRRVRKLLVVLARMAVKQQLEVDGRTLALSNLDKVLYPAANFTKAQVIEYYARVAEWILPHLRDRPVTMKRYPDGIGGKAFYEKDAPRFTPDWVAIARVPRRAGGPEIRYILINDRATLLWCANLASLELHPFLHRAQSTGNPNFYRVRSRSRRRDDGRGLRQDRIPAARHAEGDGT